MDKVLLDTTPSYLPSARRDTKKARLTLNSQSSELAAASAWTAAAKQTLPPGFFMDRNGFQQRCTLQIQNQQVQRPDGSFQPQQGVQHISPSEAPTDSECTATEGPQAGERRPDPDGISGSATAATASHPSNNDATSKAEHRKCTAMEGPRAG